MTPPTPVDVATPTPSLQRRVAIVAVGVLAVLLVILGVVIDISLDVQAHRNLHDRLMGVTSRADALSAAHTAPEQIAAELNGGGIRARLITADGTAYGDRAISPDTRPGPATPLAPPPPPPHRGPDGWGPPPPPPPPHGPPPPPPDSTATALIHPLPGGGRIILVADTTQTTQVTRQLRQMMIGAGAITLAVAAILLVAASRVALRPLDRLTALAAGITSGDRGRRLHPDRAGTELGRAASAFDDMLDALEHSERRAQEAAGAAQRAETATRRFLVDAAHELRTPIAGIQAAAEQLASNAGRNDADPIARGQFRRASLLLSDARRAGRLVADMLDLSRIDAGSPLELADTDLATVLDAEAERAAMLAPQLTITRTGAQGLSVRADPTRVAQILSNLLDNARRHTPRGGTITIDLKTDSTGAFIVITVTDTGHGIAAGDYERIFDRLVRLDEARNRDHGGAGLGLPIARALARAHGGELVCRPHQGGARFELTLPSKSEPHRDGVGLRP